MNKDGYLYRVLAVISGCILRFLSGATREWANDKVDELINSWGEGNHDTDDIPEMALLMDPDRGVEDYGSDPNDPFPSDLNDRGTQAIVIALKHRIWEYKWVAILPAVFFISAYGLNIRLNLSFYGLVFDVCGAVIVARGILRHPREVSMQAYIIGPIHEFGSPEDLLVHAAETVDGVIGVFILTLGFSFQIVDILLNTTV